MKTKLPNEYSSLPEYNYDIKLNNGLYYTFSPKYQKLNCKNYVIKPTDEITISTIGKISIITIMAIGRTKVQYLMTTEFDFKLQNIPERNLLNEYRQYLVIAKENINFVKNMIYDN